MSEEKLDNHSSQELPKTANESSTEFEGTHETNDQSINEPELMEVHHHAHHDHGKKNWKSYFWEFLMLFLAVFVGFMAEYQLEHKIEKDRKVQ